ncbi:unnamed protein product [Symbiodinium sp. KB8]|nr:unnamed protein product [Symbiodinium sp. KB8]
MNRINEIESDRLVSVVGDVALQLRQLAYIPLARHSEKLADRLGRSSAAEKFLPETLPTLRGQAAAEVAFMSAQQHKASGTDAYRSAEGKDVREATRTLVRSLQVSEAGSDAFAGDAKPATPPGQSDSPSVSGLASPPGGAPVLSRTATDTSRLPPSPFVHVDTPLSSATARPSSAAGVSPECSLVTVLQRGKLRPSPAATSVAAVLAQLQVVLRSRLAVSAEQGRQREAKVRSFEERILEEGAQLNTLKANLRAQRAEREADSNAADDQIAKLTAEIELLRSRGDKERTSLREFVSSHSASQASAHGDVLSHLNKQLQEQMAQHALAVRQSEEAEKAVRRRRDAFRADLITNILAEYDSQMLTLQKQVEAVTALKADVGARLAVLREHFGVVGSNAGAAQHESDAAHEEEVQRHKDFLRKYGPAVRTIERARGKVLDERREAAQRKKKRRGRGKSRSSSRRSGRR